MTKIAVVGSNPVFRECAPWADRSWEIWACSAHNLPPHFDMPRLDRFYEVHIPALAPEDGRDRQYIDHVVKLSNDIPVFAMDRSILTKASPYPKERVVDFFGKYFIDTSSIAYIMAHAILEILDRRVRGERDDLAILGVGQKSASEYTYQRPGIQYFLSIAIHYGIDVVYPEESEIGRAIKYKF